MSRRQWTEIGGMLWPAALSSIFFSLMEVVDTAMLGMVGVQAMAGVALGVTIIYLILAFPMYLMRAAAPLAASGRPDSIGSLVRLTWLAALALGGVATLLIFGAAAAQPPQG
jgi:Na+-driven multidrug efflux pump